MLVNADCRSVGHALDVIVGGVHGIHIGHVFVEWCRCLSCAFWLAPMLAVCLGRLRCWPPYLSSAALVVYLLDTNALALCSIVLDGDANVIPVLGVDVGSVFVQLPVLALCFWAGVNADCCQPKF